MNQPSVQLGPTVSCLRPTYAEVKFLGMLTSRKASIFLRPAYVGEGLKLSVALVRHFPSPLRPTYSEPVSGVSSGIGPAAPFTANLCEGEGSVKLNVALVCEAVSAELACDILSIVPLT